MLHNQISIETRRVNKLYLKYKNKPEFQLISFTKDEPERAEKAKAKYNISYPIYPISEKEAYRLNLNRGFPTTIITDKNGAIVYLKSGGSTDKGHVKEQVQLFEEKLLKHYRQSNNISTLLNNGD